MKLDRKQDLNVLYQVCVFRADQKTKMAALADSSKRWHIVLRCTIYGPLGLLLFRGSKIKGECQPSPAKEVQNLFFFLAKTRNLSG